MGFSTRNEVLFMVKEVHKTENAIEIVAFLNTGEWVVISGRVNDGIFEALLGRII